MKRNKAKNLKKQTAAEKKEAVLIKKYIQGYKRKRENLTDHPLFLAGLSSFSRDKW